MKIIANHSVLIFARSAHSPRVWKRILTSILLLAGIAAGIACGRLRAQQLPLATRPAAGPHRPAGVPSSYVITPFGYFHPSCVLQLNKGEHMDNAGVLHRADGGTAQVGPCQYPRYMPSGELAADPSQTNNSVPEQDQGTPIQLSITHSWIEDSSATTSTAYGKEVSTWTVPPAPLINEGQVVAFFPGFENVNPRTILQPVIEYFGGTGFEGTGWTASSWNCCQSGTVWESTPIAVNPGDTILGTTVMTCAAGTTNCSTWNVITKDQTTNQSTELSNTPSEGQVFNYAQGGALEVYYINQCLDYPPNGSISFNTLLYDSNFNQIADPGWSNNVVLSPSKQPQCNYGVATTATQTTLTYGTTGPGFGVGIFPSAGIAVNQGSSASGTLTIFDLDGFNGLVQLTASNLPAGITAQISQGSSSNTFILTVTAASSAPLTASDQPATLTITATGSGVPTQTFAVNVIVNPPLTGGSGTVVDLSNYFNLYSFRDDASTSQIPIASSLDGSGDVYSANQLSPPGTSPMGLNVAGAQFEFGPPNGLNAVYGTGSNPISLPSGKFTGLELLGASGNGTQGPSWPVVVTYTDGATQTFMQQFADWDSNNGSCTYSCTGGESLADVMTYCDQNSVTPTCSRLFYLYRYYFALDSSKTVESLTLPNDNRYIFVLAATLTSGSLITPTVTVTPSASSITTDKTLVLTVTVSGGTGNPVPTGQINISTGGSYRAGGTPLSGGSATLNISGLVLPPSNITFTATYVPDGYSASTYQGASGSSVQVAVRTAQNITFANPGTQTVGTPLTLSAIINSNLAVTFTSATPSICTVSGSTATFVTAGTCTINADQAGDSYYAAAPEIQQSFSVNGETQTVTFPTIAAQTVGTPLTLSATATSGLAVSFTSATTSICVVSGATATFIASGTCTIDANQAGNSAYAAAPQVQQSFAVNAETQTITFPMIAAQTVGTPLTLSATATSGLAVSFTSTTTSFCTVSGATATFIASGTCTIDANQSGNSAYAAAPQIQQSFAVNPGSQTITFAMIAAQTVGAPLTLSATATSGLAVSFTSTTAGICTVSGTAAAFIAAGTCTIDANQAGNSAYAAAPQVQQSFSVNGEAQTITFANPGTQTVGTPLTLSATATSGLAVSFTSTTPSICTVSGSAATFLAAGACTIDANQAGNSAYAAAPQVQQSFTVNGEAQTISFPTIATQTVGTPLTLAATATSGLAVSFTSTTTNICTVSGTTATLIASGTCTIDANQAGNSANAAAPQVQQSFTVNGEAQTISFSNPGTQTVGTPLTLAATATSGLAVSFTSTTTNICTVSGTTATLIASGTCTIDANQAGNSANAAAPQVQQSFTVNGEAQTITFPLIAAQTVGTPLTLSATSTSGLAVSFTSAAASICTVSGTTATFIASGTCTIEANQAGNSTYAAATMVPQSFTVNPAPTFTGGGGGTISIVPGATTGNTVTISVSPSNGFAGTVNLSCSISPTAASDPATCNFAPPSVTISGTTAQTSTLTIYTTAATIGANQIKHLFWPATGGTTLAVILLFGIPRRRRNWLVMLVLVVLFVSIGAVGCGGSSGGGGGGGGGNAGTTPGTYTVTVTGTSGSLTVPLGTVTLVVQ